MNHPTRRRFLQQCGLSAAALPFVCGLPSLRGAPADGKPRRRMIFVFSPNGTVPGEFWPDSPGPDFAFKRILAPLLPFRDRTLLLHGVSNKIRGDGDGHMRGMSCMLTAKELFPGNIQGGSDTPAGWASGISIDQELKNFLQADAATRTRHGNLTLGVAVPDRADPWTRWTYAAPNQPVTPQADPGQVFQSLYGSMADKETVASILDEVGEELKSLSAKLPAEDRDLLERHLSHVRDFEKQLQQNGQGELSHPAPPPDPNLELVNDRIPEISRAQIDLLVGAMANDAVRVATLQYTNSVGQARMTWLGITDGHHSLSHDPDKATESQEKLVKINHWFAGEVAHLAARLNEIGTRRRGDHARPHHDPVDQRAGKGKLTLAGQSPVLPGRRRTRLQVRPRTGTQRRPTQPPVAVGRPRFRPPARHLRQARDVQRRTTGAGMSLEITTRRGRGPSALGVPSFRRQKMSRPRHFLAENSLPAAVQNQLSRHRQMHPQNPVSLPSCARSSLSSPARPASACPPPPIRSSNGIRPRM